jgi:uncharacterized metal-binding protein
VPSGRTHDRITLWTLPVVAGLTLGLTWSSHLTLWVTSSFMFGGLMFGPDLDIHSRQYKRWGWLRWIWIPYRKMMHHRSFLSHGLFVGTLFRVIYLTIWLGALGVSGVLLKIGYDYWAEPSLGHWQPLFVKVKQTQVSQLQPWFWRYQVEAIAVLIGLEVGAMSHSLSDWAGSFYKKIKHKKNKPSKS